VFSIKVCSIVAGGAFLLSFIAGIIGGAGFIAILFRAIIFAALAFGFATGAGFLINRFLPELMEASSSFDSERPDAMNEESGSELDHLGGTVDVSVGGDTDELLDYVASAGEESAETANSSSGLDQESEGGYTEGGGMSVTAATAARPPDLIGDVDVLPDLEGLSDSFVTPITVGDSDNRSESRKPSVSASAQGSSGQFDSKEMAMAIQTILKRDQKG